MAKTAVVIGGSLCGLIHGIVLKRHGYNVTILEQEVSASRQGFDAGIRAGPELVKFLDKYNRSTGAYSIQSIGVQFLDKAGAIIRGFPSEMPMTSWGFLLSILRANFDGLLSSAIPEIPAEKNETGLAKFMNGARVVDVKDRGEKVELLFNDATKNITESISADLVLAADGSNSSIREMFLPDVSREYAGYISWRGTVREELLEEHHRQVFQNKVTIFRMDRSYVLIYVIPTDDGDFEPGKRLCNWIWYVRHDEGSEELSETMTDTNGKTHFGTVPRGLVRPDIWEKQRAKGVHLMPLCIQDMIKQTQTIFVTKIHDAASSSAVFCGGKLFLVGDALAAFRPNVALSTNQAAYDAQLFEQVLEDKLSKEQWEKAVLKYGHAKRLLSILVADYGLSSKLTLAWTACRYVWLLARQSLGFIS